MNHRHKFQPQAGAPERSSQPHAQRPERPANLAASGGVDAPGHTMSEPPDAVFLVLPRLSSLRSTRSSSAAVAPESAHPPHGDGGTVPAAGPAHPCTLPGLQPGGSLESILKMRLEQIHQHGHTPEQDREAPVNWLTGRAIAQLNATHDDLAYPERATVPDFRKARNRMVRAAALVMAQIDRTDWEIARREAGEQGED